MILRLNVLLESFKRFTWIVKTFKKRIWRNSYEYNVKIVLLYSIIWVLRFTLSNIQEIVKDLMTYIIMIRFSYIHTSTKYSENDLFQWDFNLGKTI